MPMDTASARTRLALHAADAGVWELNPATGSLQWSKACGQMHGFAPGTFGRTLDAFVGCIHPDDRDRVSNAMTTAATERAVIDVDYRTVWPDGAIHWINIAGRFASGG